MLLHSESDPSDCLGVGVFYAKNVLNLALFCIAVQE